ncbi:MAG: hypothetical protein ACJ73C_12485, partial [Nitrososphaeraceae archaeon]
MDIGHCNYTIKQLLNNNGTGIQDYTLTSNSPVVAPDKPTYLGYHDVSANNNPTATKTSTSTSDIDHSSSSKDKHKPDSHHSNGTTRESS